MMLGLWISALPLVGHVQLLLVHGIRDVGHVLAVFSWQWLQLRDAFMPRAKSNAKRMIRWLNLALADVFYVLWRLDGCHGTCWGLLWLTPGGTYGIATRSGG